MYFKKQTWKEIQKPYKEKNTKTGKDLHNIVLKTSENDLFNLDLGLPGKFRTLKSAKCF